MEPNGFTGKRGERIWRIRSGWFAHGHVPENDHTDPGFWPDFIVKTEKAAFEPSRARPSS